MERKKAAPRKRTAWIVSHTHWDREWRYPIWETRCLLVDFFDELIELLENGAYPSFLLDGQTIPVPDYLEIRPEMEERIRKLVREERLLIGPWYTLPDEYPVDGEALVRNLLRGTRLAKEYGSVLKAGYTPFGWGQSAQLPQIYAGFGLDIALIGKRVSKERAPYAEFLWRAPDGSELLSTRFGKIGRQNFYFTVHLPALFGVEYMGPEWVYRWERGDTIWHRADPDRMEQDHQVIRPPDRWYPEMITPERLELAWESTRDSLLPDDRLMMNGCDYTAAQRFFPEMLQRINEIDPDPDREWVHVSLYEYLDVMREKLDRSRLPIVEGELRDGPAAPLTGNALTTRLYIKRRNRRAQNALIRFAEPLAGAASIVLGAEYPDRLLAIAWDLLLQCHPHDSINGVTQDKTALDVEDRLRQVEEIAETIGERATQELVRRIDTRQFDEQDVLLVVFNPLPEPRREVVEAWIDVPYEHDENDFEPYPFVDPQIVDAGGRPVPTQAQGARVQRMPVAELHTRAFPFPCMRHRVFFDTGDMPACGYKIFRVTFPDTSEERGVAWAGSIARTGTLLRRPEVMENEFLRVEMNPDGTFDLVSKELGKTFRNLNAYEDRGELGDYWINRRPMDDRVISSRGCAARIWAEESGPVCTTLVSEVALPIPRHGDRLADRRGDDIEDLTIRTAVTLRAGSRMAEVTVEFENRHEDHFLRAIFPTDLGGAESADAGGHFIVDRRPVRGQGPSAEALWPDMTTLPMNGFVDLSDGTDGIAFLSPDLTEYGVLEGGEGVVALSLLRAVRNWLCTETRIGSGYPSQKGGQCLGRHRIRYAILPHAGTWKDADIPAEADRFAVRPRIVQTGRNEGTLPAEPTSLFAIDNPKLRFSALKRAEERDTWIVRVHNPGPEEVSGTIRFARPIGRAWRTMLNEERETELPLDKDGGIAVSAPPYRIVTIEIEPA